MPITINTKATLDTQLRALDRNLKKLKDIEDETEIKPRHLKNIYKYLNNNDLRVVCDNIQNDKYLSKFSYEDLNFVYDTLEQFFTSIKSLKEAIDIDIFFEHGTIIDIRALKVKFKELGRDKIYPDFNFKRLKELFHNPPTRLIPQDYSSREEILYDGFVVRKYIYAIIQMVINEMDLLIGYVGAEGMGKSCACSQDMNLVYYLLKELGLIKYKYNIREMWFNSLDNFIQTEDLYFNEKFRILALDEGNELNRQDWQNENVKTFFQRLRRERYNQRIKFICLPQLGELLTAIVLSRMNFIFSMRSKDDTRTGTIDKGFCDFFIIPRSERIYSPYHKKEIFRDEIKRVLTTNLEDKKSKYISQIPKSIIIKTLKKTHIWGFSKEDYIKHLKESNKIFSVSKGVRLTDYQAFCYYVSRPKLVNWDLDRKLYPEIYASLVKMDKQICKQFAEDPNKLEKYNKLMELKRRNK